jgi:DNA-directed RNA polymerase specialized sigma24 family protein
MPGPTDNLPTEIARPRTLGALLYADATKPEVGESTWVELVRATAAGNKRALRAVFERTQQLVGTLALRITGDRARADDVVLAVFEHVWRRSWLYVPGRAQVIAWIMSLARSKALDAVRSSPPADHTAVAEPARDAPPASGSDGSALWKRLEQRLGPEFAACDDLPPYEWIDTDWAEAGAGISYRLLSTDRAQAMVSMLVTLAPGAAYPAHRHVAGEELHLLAGELEIDGRRLRSGDYNRAEAGTSDVIVRSETGCTCVLITSFQDVLA